MQESERVFEMPGKQIATNSERLNIIAERCHKQKAPNREERGVKLLGTVRRIWLRR